MTRARRGESLLTVLGGVTVLAIVSTLVLQVYDLGSRAAARGVAQARQAELARAWGARFQADARAAQAVSLSPARADLRLPDGPVTYTWAGGRLTRRAGPVTEAQGAPLVAASFRREGGLAHLRLEFAQPVGRRRVTLVSECAAAPRAEGFR
jgi:hypothetical protein